MRKPIIIITVLISFLMLLFSIEKLVNNSLEDQIEKENIFKKVTTSFDIRQVGLSEKKIGEIEEVIALGVINNNSCLGCILELFEFYKMMKNIENKFFSAEKIYKIFVVVGEEKSEAIVFKKKHKLKNDVVFLKLNSPISNELMKWNENEYTNQWVFLNKNEKKIKGRINVLSNIAPLNFKKSVLNEIIFNSDLNL